MPLYATLLGQVDGLAVHGQRHPAEREQAQPGRGDDDVRVQLGPGGQPDPGLGERLDRVGHHRRPARPDRGEQVAVRDEAEPLVPGVVRGPEVGVDRVAVRQLPAYARPSAAAASAGAPAARAGRAAICMPTFLPRPRRVASLSGSRLCSSPAARPGRQRHHVARRALQHRHVRRVGGHRRDQGDRGRAAADHHHPRAGVVEVGGPVLRVHDPAPEALLARELGRKPSSYR